MRSIEYPKKNIEEGNLLHQAAQKLVDGLTTITELKAIFLPGEVLRILSHAEKISRIKPKTEEGIEDSFLENDIENPSFEIFFEENYMPLVEAHPDLIYKYLDTARRAFKELSQG